jgi:hypothetical protein
MEVLLVAPFQDPKEHPEISEPLEEVFDRFNKLSIDAGWTGLVLRKQDPGQPVTGAPSLIIIDGHGRVNESAQGLVELPAGRSGTAYPGPRQTVGKKSCAPWEDWLNFALQKTPLTNLKALVVGNCNAGNGPSRDALREWRRSTSGKGSMPAGPLSLLAGTDETSIWQSGILYSALLARLFWLTKNGAVLNSWEDWEAVLNWGLRDARNFASSEEGQLKSFDVYVQRFVPATTSSSTYSRPPDSRLIKKVFLEGVHKSSLGRRYSETTDWSQYHVSSL